MFSMQPLGSGAVIMGPCTVLSLSINSCPLSFAVSASEGLGLGEQERARRVELHQPSQERHPLVRLSHLERRWQHPLRRHCINIPIRLSMHQGEGVHRALNLFQCIFGVLRVVFVFVWTPFYCLSNRRQFVSRFRYSLAPLALARLACGRGPRTH